MTSTVILKIVLKNCQVFRRLQSLEYLYLLISPEKSPETDSGSCNEIQTIPFGSKDEGSACQFCVYILYIRQPRDSLWMHDLRLTCLHTIHKKHAWKERKKTVPTPCSQLKSPNGMGEIKSRKLNLICMSHWACKSGARTSSLRSQLQSKSKSNHCPRPAEHMRTIPSPD